MSFMRADQRDYEPLYYPDTAIVYDHNGGPVTDCDDNNDGQQQSGEPRLRLHPPLEGVQIYPDETSRSYIHYRPQGQAIRPNGAFHAGHFRICAQYATAHRIVINRSGRIRHESAPSASLCPR